MDRESIIVVTTSFPIANDGSEAAGSFVYDLVVNMLKSVDVAVVAPGIQNGKSTPLPGLTVYTFKTNGVALSTLIKPSPKGLVNALLILWRGARMTRACAAEFPRAMQIVALWAFPSGFWAYLTGKSYVIWTLGSDIWSIGKISVLRMLLKRVLQKATSVYSDGIELAGSTQEIAGRAVEFLPTTREVPAKYRASVSQSPPYRLLFLGRWHPNKGIDLLMQSLLELTESDWAMISEVHIVGGGPLESQVQGYHRDLERGHRPVILHGFLDKDSALQLASSADIGVIPSRIESIPVVFSDFMKVRLPVVCTPVGDLPDLMGRFSVGVVAGSATSEALTHALRQILRMDLAGLSANCSDAAAVFSLDSISSRLIESDA